MVIIIIASVSTVALLVVLMSYYYQHQYRTVILGKNQLVRFNVTNDTDKLGIFKIYPTAKNGETWFFNSADPNDGQFDSNGAEISRNSDGSWHVNPGITRMSFGGLYLSLFVDPSILLIA